MNDFGNYLLLLSWILTLFAVGAGAAAALRARSAAWLACAARSTFAAAVCAVLSVFCLAFLFLSNDYANQYVWQYSNRAMPAVYKAAAVWGGMDGSLHFWAALLTVSSAVVACRWRYYDRELLPWFFTAAGTSSFFYLTLVVFFVNPFRYLVSAITPPDGNGLNPLLQNPYMAIHPPLLYAGFTILSVPYALALAALLSGRFPERYLQHLRAWSLAGWVPLTLGIVLGGYWAYIELGWGGFWAWDPVENASLLPWLTCTALLHTLSVERRLNGLKMLNWILLILTYALTVFATFITRSGIVQSVHAFGSSDVSPSFVIYLVIIFAVSLALFIKRRAMLRPEVKVEDWSSREFAVLAGAAAFLAVCGATVWGMMLPVVTEAAGSQKRSVDAAYYNTFAVPLLLVVLLLMAVGPFFSWRRTESRQLLRLPGMPLAAAAIGALLMRAIGVPIMAAVSYALCSLVFLLAFIDLAGKARRPGWLERGKRRGLVHLVHCGVALSAFAITASMVHRQEEQFSLEPGESRSAAGFTFTLLEFVQDVNSNYQALLARVEVKDADNASFVAMLSPELRHYEQRRENTAEVALHAGYTRDIYLVLAGYDDERSAATFKLFINPFQVWLWAGTGLGILGTLIIALLPDPSRRQ